AALRSLAAALAADPDALGSGAPPCVGRLVSELIARGSALAVPACAACGRTGRPLTRTSLGGMCARCAHRAGAAGCARCHAVKPVAGRTSDGQPICERCRRRERGLRRCGRCGKTAPIAVRARGGNPDECVNCYKMPEADCSACGSRRECSFAASERPVCLSCSSTRPGTRCRHQQRPPPGDLFRAGELGQHLPDQLPEQVPAPETVAWLTLKMPPATSWVMFLRISATTIITDPSRSTDGKAILTRGFYE